MTDTAAFPSATVGSDETHETDSAARDGQTEILPLSRVEDVTGEDRRNDLSGLESVPLSDPVGLVDASVDATTQVSQVLIAEHTDLPLDTFVVRGGSDSWTTASFSTTGS